MEAGEETREGCKMSDMVKYEAAKHALAEAKRVDEIILIRDNSAAIAAAARVAKDKQLELDASEIRIRAERRLGEMIRVQKDGEGLAKGGQPYQKKPTGADVEPVEQPTLAAVGISKKLSSRSQAIAAIPEDEFEETLEEHRQMQQAVTASTMQKLAKKGGDIESEVKPKSSPIPSPIDAALNRLAMEIKLCAGSGWKRCDKKELAKRIKSILKEVIQ